MNSLKISQTKFLLLLIIGLAFSLRIINLTVGFPGLYVSNDEAVLHFSALNMISNRTAFALGNYGPLASYIQLPFLALGSIVLFLSGKVQSIAELQFLILTQEGYFLFIPRIISALFGTLIILSLFRLSIVLFKNKQIALWTSFFTAVSFNLVHISHLARSLSPALFFVSLAVLFSAYGLRKNENNLKNCLLSFIFCAFAFGFHQIMGIVILIPFFAVLKRTQFKNVVTCLSIWFCLIATFNYLGLGNRVDEVFRSNNSLGLLLIKTPAFWFSKGAQEIFLIVLGNLKLIWELLLTDGLLLLFGFFGFIKFTPSNRLKFALSIYFSVCLFLSIFVFPSILRYLLSLIVFLPVFAGVYVYYFLRQRNVFFIFLVIVLASFNSIYWNILITRESTFTQMRKWLDTNLAPSTPLAATFYRTVGYTPSKDASLVIRNFKRGYYQKSANELESDEFPYNVRNIVYLENFGKESKVENLEAGLAIFPAQYVIDGYFKNSERLLNMTNIVELVAHFSPTGEVISKSRIPEAFADAPENFPLFKTNRPGIYFDILKIK